MITIHTHRNISRYNILDPAGCRVSTPDPSIKLIQPLTYLVAPRRSITSHFLLHEVQHLYNLFRLSLDVAWPFLRVWEVLVILRRENGYFRKIILSVVRQIYDLP